MIKNLVKNIDINELSKIKAEANNQNYFIAELDGSQIESYESYMNKMNSIFDLQLDRPYNIDAYLDWMRDLEWLDKEGYILIIKNYSLFLKNDKLGREEIMSQFVSIILPFWEKKAVNSIAEGYNKLFVVYLID